MSSTSGQSSKPIADEKDRASLWVVLLVVFLLAGCAGPVILMFLLFVM